MPKRLGRPLKAGSTAVSPMRHTTIARSAGGFATMRASYIASWSIRQCHLPHLRKGEMRPNFQAPEKSGLEDEPTWLRRRVIRLRAALRFAKEARTETILREVIAEAEQRLSALEGQPALACPAVTLASTLPRVTEKQGTTGNTCASVLTVGDAKTENPV
jgi:hypothetical protein